MSDIVERLEAHMAKADIQDVLPDCREAAAEIKRLRREAEHLKGLVKRYGEMVRSG